MSDRYLFKAKRADNGEWVVWNALTGVPHDISIRQDTICQCTGLKDKNGKLIWENDIVKDKNSNFYIAIWRNDCYQYCWVCIKSIIEIFVGRKRDLWVIVEHSEIEVIGNIFDNPELLESEE